MKAANAVKGGKGGKIRAGPFVAAAALLGVLGLAAIPGRAYVGQHHDRDRLAATVADVSAENRALQDRADRLSSDAEIERLARLHYNLAKPGEEVYAILPTATVPPPPPPARADEKQQRPWWDRAWQRVTSVF